MPLQQPLKVLQTSPRRKTNQSPRRRQDMILETSESRPACDESLLESCNHYAFQFKDDSLDQSCTESHGIIQSISRLEFKTEGDLLRQEEGSPRLQTHNFGGYGHTEDSTKKRSTNQSTIRNHAARPNQGDGDQLISLHLLPRTQQTAESLKSSQNTADFTKEEPRDQDGEIN